MKKIICSFLFIILMVFVLSQNNKVYYLPFEIPGPQMAITIPPFGIFIEDGYKNEVDKPGSLLRHEKIHWQQYERMGLITFYYEYFKEYFKHDRINHWMEEEARKLSYK